MLPPSLKMSHQTMRAWIMMSSSAIRALYIIWMRALTTDAASNAVYIGVDGQVQDTGDSLRFSRMPPGPGQIDSPGKVLE